MLPPGLVRSIRYTLRPTGAESPEDLPPDAAMLLAMLHERRAVEREQVSEALGMTRARRAIRALLDAGLAVVAPEAPASYARARRERLVRLAAIDDALTRWREEARTRLGEPVSPSARAGIQGQRAKRSRTGVRAHLEPARHAGCAGAERNVASGVEDRGVAALHPRDRRRSGRASGRWTHRHRRGRGAARSPRRAQISAHAATRPHYRAIRGAQAKSWRARRPAAATFLLHGVTGSGKTEVYLQALAAVIARGKRGIALVPEIALTPQAVARYAGRFPGRVALLHSGLTDGERLDEWRRIRAGEVDVVVGSRSALFAPVERLGLIIVDEEHEGAYKEERTPTYHARDVASQLGALTGATVVLGSATPSAESYWQARQGIYKLIELRERVPIPSAKPEAEIARLPEVTLIDLRAELRSGHTSILSEPLQEALARDARRAESRRSSSSTGAARRRAWSAASAASWRAAFAATWR